MKGYLDNEEIKHIYKLNENFTLHLHCECTEAYMKVIFKQCLGKLTIVSPCQAIEHVQENATEQK